VSQPVTFSEAISAVQRALDREQDTIERGRLLAAVTYLRWGDIKADALRDAWAETKRTAK
jgi:aldehyde:ferredoxin oxidoreductase